MSLAQEVIAVLRNESDALNAFAERLTQPEAQAAIEAVIRRMDQSLRSQGKIIVTGVGKSGKIAQKIAATLSSTGSLAIYLHPTEALHGDIGVVCPTDVVLALSQTGNSEELAQLVIALSSKKIAVIAMTGARESRLAQAAELLIHTPIPHEACPHNLAPTTSTTLMLAIGDALAIALMKLRGFDAAQFAKNHPGGALGKRLTLQVRDVMKSRGDLALAEAQDPLEKIVLLFSEKRLGAVAIVDSVTSAQPRLLGLITEGDLRKALSHREKFFSLQAQQIMTKNPISSTFYRFYPFKRDTWSEW
jgi:arabinose-5-phosphate isomerase